jgi:protoporphyrin/coproporphyrin ferrochelatase
VKAEAPDMDVDVVQPFYNDPAYIDALADSMRPGLAEGFDRLLFSYHGVPERHLRLSDPSHAHCLCSADCCAKANPAHATCYRHQCYVTTQLVAAKLGLRPDQYFLSFQSRLGRDPWLTPYTDATLQQWGAEGVAKVRVVCPAFVTDCLETLEEIAVEGAHTFHDAGGGDYAVIPCLNEHPAWIQFLVDRIHSWQAQLTAGGPVHV